MASVARAKVGHHDLIKCLGSGSTADLLLVRASERAGFERHLVIKQLRDAPAKDPRFAEMFLTEARLAATLHHHNIIQLHEIGSDSGKPFFAMEYVHGEDLRNLLARLHTSGDKVPLEHVIAIVSLSAAALHHAHELAIVHRDVTPTNIIITYDGNVKVTDFGIAKAALSVAATQAGVLQGKVPYLSPELCFGQSADRRSDVFSLGIVLYELVTGRRLFKAASELDTMSAIVNGNVPRPSLHRKDLPAPLEKIMLKALARERGDRYQTAHELCSALDAYATTSRTTTSPIKLARYMKEIFGERREPWLVDAENPQRAAVDFDGPENGLAAPPTASQLLAPGRVSVKVAAAALIVPADMVEREQADVDVETEVWETSPELTVPDGRPGNRLGTETVEPLAAAGVDPRPAAPTQKWPIHARAARKRWALGGGAAAVAFVAIVTTIGLSGSDSSVRAAAPVAPKQVPTAEPPAAAVQDKSWDRVTMRDYERQAGATPQPTEPIPPADPPVTTAPAMTPAAEPTKAAVAAPAEPAQKAASRAVERPASERAQLEPVKRAVVATRPARPTASKPPIKPTRTASPPAATKPGKSPPTWDPDSLLPGK